MNTKLYTVGYGRWATKVRVDRLIASLKKAGVNLLVDIRHSPCSSNLIPASNYGPRAWHLKASDDEDIVSHLQRADIDYRWVVELGNPQKNDHAMRVLRAHIEARDERWPVNRGLRQLAELVKFENNQAAAK